ncbi:hypothetical protein Btru_053215 [Bulinus truncatus]|nr:hypothetical protein Btru_053215 [Bulinus truncatus]
MVPISMLAVMCAIPFCLSPDEPEKLMVSITLLLSFTVLTDFITGKLPEISDKISVLVWYMTSLFVQAFLGVICNACVLILNKWDNERAAHLDSVVAQLSPFLVTVATVENTFLDHPPKTIEENVLYKKSVQLGETFSKGVRSAETSRAYRVNQCLLVVNTTALFVISTTAWVQLLI